MFRSLLAWLALFLAAAAAAANAPQPDDGRVDAQLRRALENVREGRLDTALGELDRIVARYPNFRLAHLVRGDVLLARARPIEEFGNTAHDANGRLKELRAEALARLRAVDFHPPEGQVPRYLLQLDPRQKHAIVIDSSRWRVYVYENAGGTPRLVDDYYTTLGKYGIDKEREGDKKTPIGVYHVVSQIPGSKLPDLYGWGAFPINYPNEWDRRLGRTGYGIWLHGVPSDTYARAPFASDGCVALANSDIEMLAKRVQVGATPVIIADRAEWLSPQTWRAERDAFLGQLEAWRGDWESLDTERYLAHYAPGFRSGAMDLAAWSAHKRKVGKGKTEIKVSLDNLGVFRSPGRQELIEVSFDQNYRSNNLSQRTRKRQYWIQEGGRWKIAHEGPVRGAARVALPESFPGRKN